MPVPSDAKSIAMIRSLYEAGNSHAKVAKRFGVTRQAMQQYCKRHGLCSFLTSPRSPADDDVRAFAQLLRTEYISMGDAAERVGFALATLQKHAERLGIDTEAAQAIGMSHRLDGQRFGMWETLDGTFAVVRGFRTTVRCRCDCGTVRDVWVSNLHSGLSRGCGCRSTKSGNARRYVVPWRCLDTGETLRTSLALAKRAGVSSACIGGRAALGKAYLDPEGLTWVPLLDQSTVWSHKEESNASCV